MISELLSFLASCGAIYVTFKANKIVSYRPRFKFYSDLHSLIFDVAYSHSLSQDNAIKLKLEAPMLFNNDKKIVEFVTKVADDTKELITLQNAINNNAGNSQSSTRILHIRQEHNTVLNDYTKVSKMFKKYMMI